MAADYKRSASDTSRFGLDVGMIPLTGRPILITCRSRRVRFRLKPEEFSKSSLALPRKASTVLLAQCYLGHESLALSAVRSATRLDLVGMLQMHELGVVVSNCMEEDG